ncbi:hypothetical protein KQI42_15730 [Tissierella sp. MSJ-40]|uniref:Uncharacterized protein n=1 Tax=Tissierella simiarum TaxID=2841534 RepID=A0ABS6EAM5_9FIRM|nr:hypothetical protein [Tissierella simiarum]MBU5439465.1 hypothetical protein [Tissierella simiarum]
MSQVESILDLRYNLAALAIAICSEEFMLPDEALSIIEEKKFILGNEDLEDMLRLRDQGVTYRELAEIYNSTDSNIHHRLKRYTKKRTYSRQAK